MLAGVVTVAPFSVSAIETENEIVAAESVGEPVGTEQFESGIFKYSILDDGTACILGLIDDISKDNEKRNSVRSLEVPSSISGHSIKKLDSYSFENYTGLLEVVIPEGVTYLGTHTFGNCSNLESVYIPSTLEYAYSPFYNCKKLRNITFGNSITQIPKYTFRYSGITSIEIPNTVTDIGEDAFEECDGLSEIVIPEGVAYLGTHTFGDCSNLESVYIPSTLKYAYSPFYNCKKLRNVTFGNGIKKIPSFTFKYSGITSIEIPNTVTDIGEDAFEECDGLSEIVIPEGVAYLGTHTFGDCSNLESVYIPSTLGYAYSPFYNCKKLRNVTFGNGIKKIPSFTFKYSGITSIEIPDTVTNIGESAFEDCRSITSICIFYINTTISKNALKNCNNITIYSYIGSTAEQYANDNNIPFKEIGTYTSFNNTLNPVSQQISGNTVDKQSVNVSLADKLKVSVPDNIPLIGNSEFKIDTSFLPISAKIEDNKIMVGIGCKMNVTDMDSNTWCSFKKYIDKYRNDFKKGKTLTNSLLDSGKKGFASTPFSGSFEIEGYGYYEGTIENGRIVSHSGLLNIKLTGKGKKNWQTFVFGVPVVIKVSGEISADSTMKLGFDTSSKTLIYETNVDITLPKLTASVGVGVAYVADLSVYGEGKNVISINGSNNSVKGTLYGEVGVSGKFLMFEAKKAILKSKNGWTYFNTVGKSGNNVGASGLFDTGFSEEQFVIHRSYLSSTSKWYSDIPEGKQVYPVAAGETNVDDNFTVLQSNVYNNAIPKIIKAGDTTIMVWTADIDTRTSGNHTAVVYSILDSETNEWSVPQLVDNDGTADSNPDVVTDGNNIYVAWVNSNKVFESEPTMAEVAAASEIAVAKFNAESNSFTAPVMLTTNNTADYNPSIGISNGKAVVAWKNNSENSIINFSGNDTIYLAVESSDGSFTTNTYYTSDKPVYDVKTNGACVAFTVDTDGNISTTNDIEVFAGSANSFPNQITINEVMESGVKFSSINGTDYLTFIRDGVLYGSTDMNIITALSDDEMAITDDYQFVSDGNFTKLLSVEYENEQSHILSYSSDNGVWKNPVSVAKNDRYFRGLSGIISGDDLQLVYLSTAVEIGEEDLSESSDLCTTIISDKHDIEVTNAYLDEDDVQAGASVELSATVKNNGTLNESGLLLEVLDETGTVVKSENLDLTINSGKETEITTELTLPNSILRRHTYSVKITPVDSTDCDLTNNSCEFVFGMVNLQMYTVYAENKIGITVTNDSAVYTPAGIIIRDTDENGEILDSYSIGEIGANETKYFVIDEDTVNGFRDRATSLYIEVVSIKSEEIKADNVDYVFLTEKTSYQIGDTNLDGIISISDVTAIQRHIAELEVFTDEQLALADTNGDGEINIVDATHLQMYLAEYDVLLG